MKKIVSKATEKMSEATALKNLWAKEYKVALDGAKGFSFKVNDGDPRELKVSDKARTQALSKMKKDLLKQNLTTDQLIDQLAILTLKLKVMESDNTSLLNSNNRLIKAAKKAQDSAINSSKEGARQKNAPYATNKKIAQAEYLSMSKNGQITISPARLLTRLKSKYPDTKKPWTLGALKDWVTEFRNILSDC